MGDREHDADSPRATDAGAERRRPEASDDDPPRVVETAGQVGIYLGVVGLVLAVGGVVAAWLRVQPLGNVAMVLALVSVSIAMVLGMAFQAYVGDWLARP